MRACSNESAIKDYMQQIEMYRASRTHAEEEAALAAGGSGGSAETLTPAGAASSTAAAALGSTATLAAAAAAGTGPTRAEMRRMVDRLERVVSENTDLHAQVERLAAGLAASAAGLDDSNQRLAVLQRALHDADTAAAATAAESTALQTRYDDLARAYALASAKDDDVVQSVRDTVAHWQAQLGERDAELAAAHTVIAALRRELESTRLGCFFLVLRLLG